MRKRYPHFIKQALRTEWPERIMCVDTMSRLDQGEAYQKFEKQELSHWIYQEVCGDKDGLAVSRPVCGVTVKDWWDSLLDETYLPGCVWIVSYNCSRVWAMLGLWEMMEHRSVKIEDTDYRMERSRETQKHARHNGYMVIEDPPNIIKCRINGNRGWVNWIDIRNFGISRPDNRPSGADTVSWMVSCIKSMHSMSVKYSLGSLKPTVASQSMHSWRRSYYKGGVYVHAHAESLDMEGKAYVGGRCEVYRLGVSKELLHHMDVRSCYPSVCIGRQLPVRLRSVIRDPPASITDSPEIAANTIAEVAIETDEPAYPYRKDGLVIYPIGRFTTTLAGPELMDAFVHSRIRRWLGLCCYEMDDCLTDYMAAMYQMRCECEGDEHGHITQWCKSLLNSVTGKLGQRDAEWRRRTDIAADVPWGEWLGSSDSGFSTRFRAIAGAVYEDVKGDFGYDSVPSIAAWITSLARVKLLNLIRTAGWENVYYVDTDGLIVNHEGMRQLADYCKSGMQRMGELTGGGHAESYNFIGIKHYVRGSTTVCAGIPKGCIEDAGDGKHYRYTRPVSAGCKAGFRPDGMSEMRQYARHEAYRHGHVDATGLVRPFTIEEW